MFIREHYEKTYASNPEPGRNRSIPRNIKHSKNEKEEIRNLHRQITRKVIESAIKNLHTGDAYINRIEWKAETRYKPVTLWSIKRQQGRKEYPKHKDRLFNKP